MNSARGEKDPPAPEIIAYAAALKMIYARLGKKQNEVAEKINVSPSRLSRFFSGKENTVADEEHADALVLLVRKNGKEVTDDEVAQLHDLRRKAQVVGNKRTAVLREKLGAAAQYAHDSEAIIDAQAEKIEVQEEKIRRLDTEVRVLQKQVRSLTEESSSKAPENVAGPATQVSDTSAGDDRPSQIIERWRTRALADSGAARGTPQRSADGMPAQPTQGEIRKTARPPSPRPSSPAAASRRGHWPPPPPPAISTSPAPTYQRGTNGYPRRHQPPIGGGHADAWYTVGPYGRQVSSSIPLPIPNTRVKSSRKPSSPPSGSRAEACREAQEIHTEIESTHREESQPNARHATGQKQAHQNFAKSFIRHLFLRCRRCNSPSDPKKH